VQPDRTQTCLGCGATVHLPKSDEPLVCFRCRASESVRRAGATPALFQKVASPERRSPLGLRTTGLLFALFLVVAAIMVSRARGPAASPGTDTTSRQGGVEVMLLDAKRAAPASTR
jgi:hypothetical protein